MKKLIVFFAAFMLFSFTLIAQWQQANGPFGGPVYSLVVMGSNIFAGTQDGVFLSTDNGTHWSAANTGLTNKWIRSLYVSGSSIFAGINGGGVFLSTDSGANWSATGLTTYDIYSICVNGSNIFAGTIGNGVFLSTDNGANWSTANNGLTNTSVSSLAINGNNIFAGTVGGMFLSTDNGANWSAVNTGLTNLNVHSLAINGSKIFAGTGDGVFLSTDNGANWAAVNTGLADACVSSFAINGSNIFAGTSYCCTHCYGGVFLSTDNGANWSALNIGLTNTSVSSLAICGSNIFAGTQDGIFLSTDNRTNWTAVNTGLTNTSVTSFVKNGTNIFAGTWDNGVFLSTNNGTSWSALNAGLTGSSVRSLAISGSNIFAGIIGGGVFLSSNNGTNWTAVNNGLTNYIIESLATSGSNIFAGTYTAGAFLSTNNGTNWSAVNTGLTYNYIYSLAISGSNIFAGTGDGVFLSTDNGVNWSATSLTNNYVHSLAVSGNNIFAGTYTEGIFLSTNNGASWSAINNGLTASSVSSLAISGSNIFAGTQNGIFLSTDNGANWSAIGLTYNYIYSIAISDSNIFAGTWHGVFLSSNNGTNWSAAGLTNTYVTSLVISGSNIFASTYDDGVFLSTDNGANWCAVNSGLTNKMVSSFALSGNNIFAGTQTGIFLSSNNGTNWSAVNTGLTNKYVYSFAVSESNIFAGTKDGVFLSTDSGTNWSALNTGLKYNYIHSLTINGSKIFAGTHDGIFLSTDNGAHWSAKGLTNEYVHSLAISGNKIFAGTQHAGVFLSTDNGTNWSSIGLLGTDIYSLCIYGNNIIAGTYGHGVFLSTDNGMNWSAVNTGLANTRVLSLIINEKNIFAGTLRSGVWKRPILEITGNLSFDNATTYVGEVFEIDVETNNLNASDSVIAYQFDFNYEDTEIEYLGNTITGTLSEGGTLQISLTAGKLSIAWDRETPLVGGGEIIKLQFKSKEVGIASPTITNAFFNTTAFTSLTNGTITQVISDQPANSAWAMYQHDNRHSGRSSFIGPECPHLKWQYTMDIGENSINHSIKGRGMVIGEDGTLYLSLGIMNYNGGFSDATGTLFSISSNGNENWQLEYPGVPYSVPTISSDGTIYLHADGNEGDIAAPEKLFAINPDGTIKWIYSTGFAVLCGGNSSPVIGSDSSIYFSSKACATYRISPSGILMNILESVPHGNSITSSPAISDDGYIVTPEDGLLKKYTPMGTLIISKSVPFPSESDPVSISIDDDSAFYFVNFHRLFKFSSSGDLIWSYTDFLNNSISCPAISENGPIISSFYDGIYALSNDGNLRWKYPATTYFNQSPTIDANGTIYFFEIYNGNDRLTALNQDGSLKWNLNLGTQDWAGRLQTCIINENGILYIVSRNTIFAFENLPLPTKPQKPIGPAAICQNPTNQTCTTTGSTNATSYIWKISPINAGTITGTDSVATVDFDNTFIGTAQITVKGQNSCGIGQTSDSLTVTIGTVPFIASLPNGTTTLCQNPENQNYTTTGANGADTYLWEISPNNAGTITGTGLTATVDFDNAFIGTAQITVTGQNECGVGQTSDLLSVTIGTVPLKTAIPNGPTALHINPTVQTYTTSGALFADTYSWVIFPNNAGIITASDTIATVDFEDSFTGTVQLAVMGQNTCGNGQTSDSLNIIISTNNSIDVNNSKNQIEIYPNPSNNKLYLNGLEEEASISIFDLTGIKIFEDQITNKQIDIINFQNGIYIMKIKIEKGIVIKKFVKQ